MDPNEPPEPNPREPEAPGGAAYEALRRLEERLDRASDAAERLLAEAAARAAAGGRPRRTRVHRMPRRRMPMFRGPVAIRRRLARSTVPAPEAAAGRLAGAGELG